MPTWSSPSASRNSSRSSRTWASSGPCSMSPLPAVPGSGRGDADRGSVLRMVLNATVSGQPHEEGSVPNKRICILLLEDSLLDAELIEARLSRGEIDFAMDRVDTRDDYVSALETG